MHRNQSTCFCGDKVAAFQDMPIYEYRCRNGHTFEVSQSMSVDPVTSCEECGAPVERVFHPVAVHFKGSGFYTTDYAKKGSAEPSADGAGAKSEADSAKSEAASSDTKSKSKSGSGSGSGSSSSEKSKSSSSAD